MVCSLARSYYHGAAGCIIVYDITSEVPNAIASTCAHSSVFYQESFTKVESQWLKEVTQYADPNIFLLLVRTARWGSLHL
jgi:GTPase SAR1 family protein